MSTSSVAHVNHRQRKNHRYNRRELPAHARRGGENKALINVDERKLTQSLESTLIRRGMFESDDGSRKRKRVLLSIQKLLSSWAETLGSQRPEASDDGHVALCTFGSYRLGVHRPDADIDALALCPPHCTRTDFFSSLVQLLQSDPSISDLHPISSAYTPVIKFTMDKVQIDLVFGYLSNAADLKYASRTLLSSPNAPRIEFQLKDEHLRGLDDVAARSINGVRVAQMLLQLVPNIDNYRITLRAVKEWATVYGLYSNVLGFLGGVNWAILVAYVCRDHPNQMPSFLLYHFFQTFSNWHWPKPVSLQPSVSNEAPAGLSFPVWNSKCNTRDLMPILTPAYPSMNSSYNVGRPQLRRLQYEFRKAELMVAAISRNERSWEDIFRDTDFFRQHLHYLQVNIIAGNPSHFRSWFGLCESKLRILIASLDSPDHGIEAYPFAKFFQRRISSSDDAQEYHQLSPKSKEGVKYMSSFFIALRFAYGVENVDLKSCTSEFLYKVNSWHERQYGMDLTIEHKTQHNLPRFVYSNQENKPYFLSDKRQSAKAPTTAKPSPAKRARNKSPPTTQNSQVS